jgi:nucleotide-binding universal stress UspA family protein
MYKKILVPLDGSPLSEGVLPYVRAFAKSLQIPVELLQAIEPEELLPAVGGKPERYREILAAQRESMGDYLKRLSISFPEPWRVSSSVEVGKPAEVIIDRAAADAGTLIAMSTHGRSGVQRWLLGSVAEKVLHATSSHLLLVRPTEKGQSAEAAPLKSVIVPLDGSELAESVIPDVLDLAKSLNLEIVLVRVFHLPIEDPQGGYGYDERIREMVKEEAESYLEQKVKQLRLTGGVKLTSTVLEGFPAASIIDLAQKTSQNLVAMCTHGRSGIGRWVLGSVTDRVVRHSGDPVLVIRAPGAA